jgi:hypothetical protein
VEQTRFGLKATSDVRQNTRRLINTNGYNMTMTTPFQAVAAYDFQGTFSSNHQLLIRANDPLQVLDKTATGWLWGVNLRTGQSGWFPSTVARLGEGGTIDLHPYPVQNDMSQVRQPDHRQLRQKIDTDDEQGFRGRAMGGLQSTWTPPPPPAIIPSASREEPSNATYVPVPKGPKRQNPMEQTSWVLSKTARRTGRLFAKASRKVGTTVLKRPPSVDDGEERPPEIILPSVRLTGSSGTDEPSNNKRRIR